MLPVGSNVQPWAAYAALRQLLADRRRHFYDSTNVGAGLPILSTLRHVTSAGGAGTSLQMSWRRTNRPRWVGEELLGVPSTAVSVYWLLTVWPTGVIFTDA